MKKTDIVKLALNGWKLSDIKELVELEKTMNDIEIKEDENDKKEDEEEDKKEEDKKEEDKKEEDKKEDGKEDKTMNYMEELIKKLQDDKTREKINDDKNEEDILRDMFRDFM